MTQDEILKILRELIVELSQKANPSDAKEISKLKSIIGENITPSSPLSALGWDSLQMTFLLVAIEERFQIDTSTISLFDLFTIGDFLTEIQNLLNKKRG